MVRNSSAFGRHLSTSYLMCWYGVSWQTHPLTDAKLGDVTSHLDIGGEQTIGQQTFALCRQKEYRVN